MRRALASRCRSESGWDAAVCWSIGRAGGKGGRRHVQKEVLSRASILPCKGVGGNTDAAAWGAEARARSRNPAFVLLACG